MKQLKTIDRLPRKFRLSVMLENSIRRMPRAQDIARMTTQELRDTFLISNLFAPGEVRGQFTDLDRLVVGGIMPAGRAVELPKHKETGRAFFLERRELGTINIGGAGKVTADGKTFALDRLDCVYVPLGSKSVTFESVDAKDPAKFYFLSCPAHAAHPATMMKSADATPVNLGAMETANKRTIYKFIHQGGIQSCQLVMGLTALEPGNVWNSFPPHTHWRRTEIYFYFDLGAQILSHFFGEPQETRHLFLHNEEVALSPNWSMHFGVGTGNYKFIWGMAGENQMFDDMDAVKPIDLR
jgi:4-deoxy-L-threo-5-hexosulose-uronate ketol-isomerase